jgi:hypothetical protein
MTAHCPQRFSLVRLRGEGLRAVVLLALACIGCLTVSCQGKSTVTPAPVPQAGLQAAPPGDLPPVIFVMLDWFNGDWGNPDYRFSYIDQYGYRQDFRGHPEYGALGGWTAFEWRDLNPGKGYYDWSKTDKYIKDAQSMRVTLDDRSVIAKPVGISVQTWAMEDLDNQIGINYTPGWVATEMGTSASTCYDPDGVTVLHPALRRCRVAVLVRPVRAGHGPAL